MASGCHEHSVSGMLRERTTSGQNLWRKDFKGFTIIYKIFFLNFFNYNYRFCEMVALETLYLI